MKAGFASVAPAALLTLAAPMTAVSAPPGLPASPADRSVTHVAVIGMEPVGWFLCDVLNAPAAVIVGRPGIDGKASIAVLLKGSDAPPVVKMYDVGRPDPGAGQVHWPLGRGGTVAGDLHAFSPGMYDAAAVTTPPFISLRLATTDYRCRWLARTRLIAFAGKRSVVVRAGRGGALTYESFDYAANPPIVRPDGVQQTTRATVRAEGGIEAGDGKGGTLMRFAGGGRSWTVHLPARGQAFVEARRGNAPPTREPLIAWTFAPR